MILQAALLKVALRDVFKVDSTAAFWFHFIVGFVAGPFLFSSSSDTVKILWGRCLMWL